MANTYTQISIHAIFTVKGRHNLITKTFQNRLHEYITGILKAEKQYPLAVNGWKDHIHIYFELHPSSNVANILKVVKSKSCKWINENQFVLGQFSWQEGYGAFSYAKSQRKTVIKYIMEQEFHHKKKSFQEEYFDLLNKFEIEYNDNYVFEFYD